jgi:hypothetical protein
MTVTLDKFMEDFTSEERAKVAACTAELIEEELTLRDLRQAQHLTQEQMAELMGHLRGEAGGASCRGPDSGRRRRGAVTGAAQHDAVARFHRTAGGGDCAPPRKRHHDGARD